MCLDKKVIMEYLAIISKNKSKKNINKNFLKDDLKQSRVITGKIQIQKKDIELINIYVPNGNPVETEKYDYKKKWLNKFTTNIKKTFYKFKYINSGRF